MALSETLRASREGAPGTEVPLPPEEPSLPDAQLARPPSTEVPGWLYDLVQDLSELFLVPHGFWGTGAAKGQRVPTSSSLAYFWLVPEGAPFESFRKLVLSLVDHARVQLVEQSVPLDPDQAEEVDLDDIEGSLAWKLGKASHLKARTALLSFDTPEHRALAAFLTQLLLCAKHLEVQLLELTRQALGPGESGTMDLLESAARKCRERVRQIRGLMGLPILGGVSLLGEWPCQPSGVFEHDPLYRRLWDLMTSYRRLPEPPAQAAKLLLTVTAVEPWRLFELWCLFRLRDALRALQGPEIRESWFEEDGPLRLTARVQDSVAIRWADGTTLRYQQRCPVGGLYQGFGALAMSVVPDFIVQSANGEFAVFDAKNKGVNDLGHRGAPGYVRMTGMRPLLPWHQLHTYQGGIRFEGRGPHSSYLLVPERGEEPDDVVKHLFETASIRRTRFGAIALSGQCSRVIPYVSDMIRG